MREEWLIEAIVHLSVLFADIGDGILPAVRVSCSWPSRGGLSTKRRVLGECWHGESSEDGICQIFVSPFYAKNDEILPVLVHELAHVVAGPDAAHKGEFVKIIRKLGLEGKPTATHASPELLARLNALVTKEIGDYPHSALKPEALEEKKQTTRMLKAECPDPDCGCTFRITQKWVDEAGGTLICPVPDCEGEIVF